MKKALTALLLVFTCLLTLASSVQADDFELPAKNGLAFELETGKILYEKKAKRAVPVASISKILTTYMVYKEIKAGKLHWDTPVTISNYPYELTTNYNISNVL